MEKRTQFRIDSIEELKEAFENLDFYFPLENEIDEFKKYDDYRYVSCNEFNSIWLCEYNEHYKTIPNPFKQPQLKGIDKALSDLQNESKKLGFGVEVIFKSL